MGPEILDGGASFTCTPAPLMLTPRSMSSRGRCVLAPDPQFHPRNCEVSAYVGSIQNLKDLNHPGQSFCGRKSVLGTTKQISQNSSKGGKVSARHRTPCLANQNGRSTSQCQAQTVSAGGAKRRAGPGSGGSLGGTLRPPRALDEPARAERDGGEDRVDVLLLEHEQLDRGGHLVPDSPKCASS